MWGVMKQEALAYFLRRLENAVWEEPIKTEKLVSFDQTFFL